MNGSKVLIQHLLNGKGKGVEEACKKGNSKINIFQRCEILNGDAWLSVSLYTLYRLDSEKYLLHFFELSSALPFLLVPKR